MSTPSLNSPFLVETTHPWVAKRGARCGYLQLAPAQFQTRYQEVSGDFFRLAQLWATLLEKHEAERVYWITLSEQVRHLHIHLYPRWSSDTVAGIPLFEERNESEQPVWTHPLKADLDQWAKQHQVYLID